MAWGKLEEGASECLEIFHNSPSARHTCYTSGTQGFWLRPSALFVTPTLRPSSSGEQYQISSSLLPKFVRGVRWMGGWMDAPCTPPSPFSFSVQLQTTNQPLESLPSLTPSAATAWLEGLTADTLGNKYRLRATTFSCHPSIHQGFLYILGNTLMLVRQLLIVMSYIKIILN